MDFHKNVDKTIMLNELLEREGHRIKFLFINTQDRDHLPELPSAYVLPVMHTFIYSGRATAPHAFLKSATNLQYLGISLSSTSSVTQLQPHFRRLRGLNLSLVSLEVTILFFSFLSQFYNLRSLSVRVELHGPSLLAIPDTSGNPMTITRLPNLTFLYAEAEGHTLMEQLRTPALRTLTIERPSQRELCQPKYAIFDEYDLSAVTHLSILGYSIIGEDSAVQILGSAGLLPEQRTHPLNPFGEPDPDVDLRGDILTSIPPYEPTRFSVWSKGPDSEYSFPSKVLSKLHNLEALSIDPYYLTAGLPFQYHLHMQVSLKAFFKGILYDSFNLKKLRRLIINDAEGHLDLLRMIFDVINDCSSLSHLNTITFRVSYLCMYSINGNDFGEELVRFLHLRREAGYEALQKFKLEGNYNALPEEWIAEAATLGTDIEQSYYKDVYPNFCGH